MLYVKMKKKQLFSCMPFVKKKENNLFLYALCKYEEDFFPYAL